MGGPLVGVLQGIQTGNYILVFANIIVLVLLLLIAFPIHELAHAGAGFILSNAARTGHPVHSGHEQCQQERG